MTAQNDESLHAFRDPLQATQFLRLCCLLHDRMGLSVVLQESGVAVLAMGISEEVQGAGPGVIHGGMLATMADVTCAMSLEGSYDADAERPVTTDMHIRYYRQPRSGPLLAKAEMVHRGRRLLSSECTIEDAEERVLARTTGTYMIVPLDG
jgi:uncharacterized protein (TIGR00369 family)